MSLKYVPADHLVHLVAKLGLPDDKLLPLLEKAKSRSQVSRQAVFDALKASNPKVAEQLADTWSFREKRAFFMWDVIALNDVKTGDELGALVVGAVHRGGHTGTLVGLKSLAGIVVPRGGHRKQAGFARVSNVRLKGDRLSITVLIDRPVELTHEDDTKTGYKTVTVRLALEAASPYPRVEAFASKGYARKATITFLQWLTGRTIDTSRAEVNKVMLPVTFSEQHIREVKAAQGAGVSELAGPTKDGKKERTIRAFKDGGIPGVLDETDPEFIEMDDSDLNKRALRLNFAHPDGFVEPIHVKFRFDESHSHLTFTHQTSKPAMQRVIELAFAPSPSGN